MNVVILRCRQSTAEPSGATVATKECKPSTASTSQPEPSTASTCEPTALQRWMITRGLGSKPRQDVLRTEPKERAALLRKKM